MTAYPRLVADIGGTHTRFAISDGDAGLRHRQTLRTSDHAGLGDAIEHYLASIDPVVPVTACIAIAGPVEDGRVTMTNHNWTFSIAGLQRRFGWRALQVVNDFAAVAMALPHLRSDQTLCIGGGRPQPGMPLGVLGPGTGFGAAQLIPYQGHWIPVSTEGGHVLLAAGNETELAIFEYWLKRDLFLSRENLLSGPGIFRLYEACCAINGQARQARDAVEVSDLAIQQGDALARQTLDIFFGLLGSACGDQALATGAHGGIYLAGGILPKMSDQLIGSDFRRRFEDKGPMSHYVQDIQTHLIIAPDPGLLGAAHYPLGQSRDAGEPRRANPENPS